MEGKPMVNEGHTRKCMVSCPIFAHGCLLILVIGYIRGDQAYRYIKATPVLSLRTLGCSKLTQRCSYSLPNINTNNSHNMNTMEVFSLHRLHPSLLRIPRPFTSSWYGNMEPRSNSTRTGWSGLCFSIPAWWWRGFWIPSKTVVLN